MTHIMTSTRRLRRVESENQIWLVIPHHCLYKTEMENEILITIYMDATSFFFCTFFCRGASRRISSLN